MATAPSTPIRIRLYQIVVRIRLCPANILLWLWLPQVICEENGLGGSGVLPPDSVYLFDAQWLHKFGIFRLAIPLGNRQAHFWQS